jgi:hypothetical protein
MEVRDLWGNGASLSGGILNIPLSNLEDVGLSPSNTDKRAIAVAVLLLAHEYFQGLLVDGDGEAIADDDDQAIADDQNTAESDCNFQFLQKTFSADDSQLFWDYIISFYSNA